MTTRNRKRVTFLPRHSFEKIENTNRFPVRFSKKLGEISRARAAAHSSSTPPSHPNPRRRLIKRRLQTAVIVASSARVPGAPPLPHAPELSIIHKDRASVVFRLRLRAHTEPHIEVLGAGPCCVHFELQASVSHHWCGSEHGQRRSRLPVAAPPKPKTDHRLP